MQTPCGVKLRSSAVCYQRVIFFTGLKETQFIGLLSSLYGQLRVRTYICQSLFSQVAKTVLIERVVRSAAL